MEPQKLRDPHALLEPANHFPQETKPVSTKRNCEPVFVEEEKKTFVVFGKYQ
jgi:hypothetical protein